MIDGIIPGDAPALATLRENPLDRIARRMVLSLLRNLRFGGVHIVEGRRRYSAGETAPALQATVYVHHPRFYSRVLFSGSLGAAEAYMDGLWSADVLSTLMRIMALNQAVFSEMEKGAARLTAPVYRLYHLARKNTRIGSRRNILAHYDLGNEFYALFLDPTMTYSCGIFESEQSTMEAASIAKYDRICR